MRLLDSMLEYNEYFVKFEEYQKYKTEDKYPAKRVVMFTCMDTRLVELSTKSLNLSSGDVKVSKKCWSNINASIWFDNEKFDNSSLYAKKQMRLSLWDIMIVVCKI